MTNSFYTMAQFTNVWFFEEFGKITRRGNAQHRNAQQSDWRSEKLRREIYDDDSGSAISWNFAFDGDNIGPQEIRRDDEDFGFPPPFGRAAHNQRARIYRPGQGQQRVPKTDIATANGWLEDVFPIDKCPYLGAMLVFGGVMGHERPVGRETITQKIPGET